MTARGRGQEFISRSLIPSVIGTEPPQSDRQLGQGRDVRLAARDVFHGLAEREPPIATEIGHSHRRGPSHAGITEEKDVGLLDVIVNPANGLLQLVGWNRLHVGDGNPVSKPVPHGKVALLSHAQKSIDPAEAQRRIDEVGPNRLREIGGIGEILWKQFKSLVALLRVVVIGVSFVGQIIEGAAIAVVLALNIAIGFFTEWRAVRSMEALQQLGQVKARIFSVVPPGLDGWLLIADASLVPLLLGQEYLGWRSFRLSLPSRDSS